MYPYNRINQPSKTSLEAKESMQKSNHYPAIKDDQRLEQIIIMSQKEALDLMRRYQKMMNAKLLEESKSLTKTMYLDEMKHLKELQEILYLLGKPTTVPAIDFDATQDFSLKELVEDTLLLEMDNGNFYGDLALSMSTEAIKNIFTAIAWNKQTHSSALSYLFSKYFR